MQSASIPSPVSRSSERAKSSASLVPRPRSFSFADRAEMLARMEKENFDLVIIGGGITGAGVARDAASRGMTVALVEAKDFAVGTSSRSSKLIHGGIRYLENLEFGLVFEALSERRLLFEIAPHLVHPLRFVLPLYRGGRVGMFKMGLGMWLYDALSMFEAPELHERLNAGESLERLPLLRETGLLGSYVYSDAYMDDDRLTLETLRSAARLGALAVNYASADDAELVEGKVRSVGVTDHLSGRRFRLHGKHFISTVGPWTDRVGSSWFKNWQRLLRPSKGVHLTFDRKRLPLHQAVVMAAEKRIVFGIPRHEMIIIGTTDTDYPGDPYDVSTTPEDVRYLMNVASNYFPGAKLTADDIIASYAGVRPLVDDQSETESKTSREHLILNDPRNITFVAGGKYTTYRRMAEQTVEAALENFSLEEQVRFSRNDTKRALNDSATVHKIDEAMMNAPVWAQESGLPQGVVEFLISRHGEEVLSLLAHSPGLPGRTPEEKTWAMEVHQAVHQTLCLSLIDFYIRRSPLFLARADHGLSLIGQIARAFAHELSWSDQKKQEQIEEVERYIQSTLAWRLKL